MTKLLSSIKLAVVIIAALVVASIFATMYPSVTVYKSIWFRGLLLLFALNLFVCTINRIPGMLAKLRKNIDTNCDIKNFEKQYSIEDVATGEAQLRSFLKEKGFKIQEVNNPNKLFFLAKKGSLNLIAPHLLHISLIVVLLGAFIGSFGTNDRVMGFVGDQVDIPSEIAQNMAIQVNDFQTLYDSDGSIDNWVTDITIYVNDNEASSGTTRVNNPFKHKGIVFYQSSYGYNHLIEVKGEQDEFYAIPDGQKFSIGDTFFNILHLKEGILIKLYEGRSVIDAKYLQEGETIDFPGGETLVYVELNPYTVLAVKVDPGTNIVMLGFLLMIVSSTMFWSGRYREVNAVLAKTENKLYVNIRCKNEDIKQDVNNQLAKRVGGKQ
ncbi:MAG: hypothetical protein APF76_02450 [Desulfitibacter sp. BRH_c19]|nr:MAG: hypothetical protein APF76_02450 [Desulfitibacter sp. BRH_c19]